MDKATPAGSLHLYRRLLSHVSPYKAVFGAAVTAMLVAAIMEAAFAALLKEITDRGLVAPDPEFIQLIPWLLLGVLITRAVSGFISAYSMAWIGRRVVMDLRALVFDRLVYLPARYFDEHASTTLVSKLIYDVEQTATATTDALTLMTKDTFTAIALILWMLYLDWRLTLVFFVFAPLIAWSVQAAARRFRNTSTRIQDSIGVIGHVAKEAIQGQRVVKTFGGQHYEIDNFRAANQRNRHQEMKRAAVASAMEPTITLMVGLPIAIVIYFAVTRTGADAVSAGTFTSYLATVLLLLAPMKRLARVNEKVQMGVAAAHSVFSVADEPMEQDTGSVVPQDVHGRIEYKNVTYRYQPAARDVLQDLSFVIEPGRKFALVGASGSGKSTIAALLLGFYRPTSGSITLDGVELSAITLKALRENMAIVTQETILFDDTIRNNIVYGSSRGSETHLQQVVAAARVNEFTDGLADGLDTHVGEQGVKLSGGQRQRIAIARALYKDAPILILDEATSSLDSVSERLVKEATDSLVRDRTTLIIAHRLSTIESADCILVMDKGRIVERGTHQELLKHNGHYARLYHSQFRESQDTD